MECEKKQAPTHYLSADEDEYCYSDLSELLGDNEHLLAGNTVWNGEAVAPEMHELCNADDVITMMSERADSLAGEYADGYPDVPDYAKAELDALLAAWMAKHCPPSFYRIKNVEAYVLTTDDLPEPDSEVAK